MAKQVKRGGYDEPYKYYPAPQVSARFRKELARIGGNAPTGEPLLRVVWGMDETQVRGVEARGDEVVPRLVPRFVGSKRVVRIEHRPQGTIITDIEDRLELYGTPRWFILEYHDPNEMGPSYEVAEREWERLRWKTGIGPGYDADGNPAPTVVKRDVLGPFPKDRYKYFCKLEWDNGDYAHPDEFWLNIIRQTLRRRDDRRFVSVEAEVKALCDEIDGDKRLVTERIWEECEDELKVLAHRLVNPARAGKGGQRPDRVILAGG